ncbi:MAG: hypothetical protein ACYC1L_06260 [Alphaproteobacteria bacterium]
MRIRLLTVALVGLSFVLPAPAAFAAKKATSSQHQKCANLDGDAVIVTGTALGATFNRGRDETYFMVVKGDLPCDAIDVVVKGPLDCGGDRQVRVEGKLRYDDTKIVNAYLEDATVVCAQPPGQAPATAAAPAASAPAAAEPPKAPVLAEPKAATETPSFYKLP